MTQLSGVTQAFITAAGRGERLKPFTDVLQKTCFPILRELSLIEFHVRQLVAQGIQDFVINLHYRPGDVVKILGDGKRLGCRIKYSDESTVSSSPLGTGGALVFANQQGLLQDRFLFVYGDTVQYDSHQSIVEGHKYIRYHNPKSPTIVCTGTDGCPKRGDVIVSSGSVNRVREVVQWLPRPHQVQRLDSRTALNAGIYSVDRQLLDRYAPSLEHVVFRAVTAPGRFLDPQPYSFDADFIPAVLQLGVKIHCVHNCTVKDIGSWEGYVQAYADTRIEYSNKALFLDRDGVILEPTPRKQYVTSVKNAVIRPGIKELIAKARQANYIVLQVSNQPHVARGLMPGEEATKLDKFIEEECKLSSIYICRHHEKVDCVCRKPKPGLLLDAAFSTKVDLSQSLFLGDSLSDVQAAVAVGCRPVYIQHEHNKAEQTTSYAHLVSTFEEVVELL